MFTIKKLFFWKKIGENRTTARGILTSALGVAEKLLDGFPIFGPKAAISATLEVLRDIDQTAQNTEILEDLLGHIEELIAIVLEPVSQQQQFQIPDNLAKDLESLTSELKRLAVGWRKRLSRPFFRRFLNRDADFGDLKRFEQGIKQALSLFQASSLIYMRTAILQDRAHARAQELSNLVSSLPYVPSAAFDSERPDAPSLCFEGTRVTILSDIIAWANNNDPASPRVFWLNGLVGTGKSTIAKTIARRCDEERILGVSFFFSRSEHSLRNPALVFPTLAFHLAQIDAAFKTSIGEAIEADPRSMSKQLSLQFDKLIVKPLSTAPSVQRTVVIVLDALDECEDNGAAEILRLILAQAAKFPFILRIFITSRPASRIRTIFDKDKTHITYTLHDVDAPVVQKDIQRYVKRELDDIPTKLDLQIPSPWLSPDERNKLLERIGKLFIYATMVVRFIGDNRVRHPRRQLDILLGIRLNAEAKPFGLLDALYLEIIIHSLPERREKEDIEQFQIVIGTIVLLRDPLSIQAIARFTSTAIDSIQRTLYHLHSVFIMPLTDDGAPRVYHRSFTDFLIDRQRCAEQDLAISSYEHEPRLVIRCLELMVSMLKRDIGQVAALGALNSDVPNLEDSVNQALSSELRYACLYWSSHLDSVEAGDGAVIQMLERFSFRCMLWWFEVMSLLGSTSLALTSIYTAHRWAVKSQCDPDLVQILSDASRFIRTHTEVIKTGASQVYYSALPFVPRETALFKMFGHESSSAVQVLQGVPNTWPSPKSVKNAHEGHSKRVFSAVFSLDGSRVASGSRDKTIRVWDASSGTLVAIMRGHSDSIGCLAFSPDGSRIASGSQDCTVRVWDTASGALIATMNGHSEFVASIAYSPSGSLIVSGSWDETIRAWDTISFSPVATMAGHTDEVNSVVFSRDGSRIVSGSADTTVRVWRAPEYESPHPASELLSSLPPSPGSHSSHRPDPKNESLSPTPVAIMAGHSDWVTSVALSPDGLRVASGSWDHSVRLWDTLSGTLIATLQGHSESIREVKFSSDGLSLTSRTDRDTIIWDATTFVQLTPPAKCDSVDRMPSDVPLLPLRAPAIFLRDRWIYLSKSAGELVRVCRVPDSYGQIFPAVYGEKIALGCGGGQVLILDLTRFKLPHPVASPSQ